MPKKLKQETTTNKIYKHTLRDLRIVAALSTRTQLRVLDELISKELVRLKKMDSQK